MASRTQLAVLEPTPKSALNVPRASSLSLKRRKTSHHDYIETKSVSTPLFTIRAHAPASHSSDHHRLAQITFLSRSRLPLSWLDPCPGTSRRIQSGRLFVANIPALEQDPQCRNEPTVLAARLADEPAAPGHDELYVLEKVKRGLYAVCALGDWVEEGDLLVASKGSVGCGVPTTNFTGINGTWLDTARIDGPLVDSEDSRKRKGINVSIVGSQSSKTPDIDMVETGNGHADNQSEVLLDICKTEGHTLATKSVLKASSIEPYHREGNRHETDQSVSAKSRPDDPMTNEQQQEEIFPRLRTQYLEALYISKTSVAYFAKGPLSRARAAFQRSDGRPPMDLSDLCAFYRDCVLPMKKMDLKYRDTIPEIVRNAVLELSDGGNAMKPKKRKSKRKKIGKNGLYAEEDEFILKWWRNRDVTESTQRVQLGQEEEMKRLVVDLRVRETQLQILFILEAIALESILKQDPAVPAGDASKPRKTKKSQDLSTSLELLLDRLCIWHAVNLDEVHPGDITKERGKSQSPGRTTDNDKLKDFCTEVVIPFYAARLPAQCKAISHKLGGPISMSPTRGGSAKQRKTAGPQPGTTVRRMPPNQSRRTLQRVLTDEQIGSKRKVPSLARTSTAPSFPETKRESTEPDLLSQIKSARGGIQKPRRVDNREVDLDTLAKQHETKLKKMNTLLEQKKELDAAINALRKPNRELVARDLADSVEQRAALSNSKKPKDSARNSRGQGVQVMATPKGWRKKDCAANGLALRLTALEACPEGGIPTVSDMQTVPSSVRRSNATVVKDSPAIRKDNDSSVFETPSRPSQQFSQLLSQADEAISSMARGGLFRVPSIPNLSRGIAHGSPTMLRKVAASRGESNTDRGSNPQLGLASMIHETPPRPNIAVVQTSTRNKTSIPLTPTRPTTMAASITVDDTSLRSSPTAQHGATTIYDQLGWNDDDDNDDELALP